MSEKITNVDLNNSEFLNDDVIEEIKQMFFKKFNVELDVKSFFHEDGSLDFSFSNASLKGVGVFRFVKYMLNLGIFKGTPIEEKIEKNEIYLSVINRDSRYYPEHFAKFLRESLNIQRLPEYMLIKRNDICPSGNGKKTHHSDLKKNLNNEGDFETDDYGKYKIIKENGVVFRYYPDMDQKLQQTYRIKNKKSISADYKYNYVPGHLIEIKINEEE